jgi:hypothetical protein
MSFFNPVELIMSKLPTPSETKQYGKVLDPAQFIDPKNLGRVKVFVEELHKGIPHEDLPWTQMKRHGSYGSGKEVSHFRMPQKDSVVEAMFGRGDAYSPTADGAPFFKGGMISEIEKVAKQFLHNIDKDPLGNFVHHIMGDSDSGGGGGASAGTFAAGGGGGEDKKYYDKDQTQWDGPNYEYIRGKTVQWHTAKKSQTKKNGDSSSGSGGSGGASAGTFAEEGEGDSTRHTYSEKELKFGIVKEPRDPSKKKGEENPEFSSHITCTKDAVTIEIGDTKVVFTKDSITSKTATHKNEVTDHFSTIGETRLGADDASNPAYGVRGGRGQTTATSGAGAVLVNATLPGPPNSLDTRP